MSAFNSFEREVVTALVGRHLAPPSLASVLEEGTLVSLESTGTGYFLTVAHPDLPVARTVCNEPTLIGSAEGFECGFVVFLEDGELVLECHDWGGGGLPADLRERAVELAEVG